MSGCWARPTQRNERGLPERAALFYLRCAAWGQSILRASRGLVVQRGTRLPSQKGYSLSEENTPFEIPRERRGESPSTPALAVSVEGVRRLRSGSACVAASAAMPPRRHYFCPARAPSLIHKLPMRAFAWQQRPALHPTPREARKTPPLFTGEKKLTAFF